jgi:CheY-like chemotaxis protein
MDAMHIWASPAPKSGLPQPAWAADELGAAPGRRKILVIEDDPIVSLGIEHLLTEAGYAIVGSCGRGEEAVAVAELEEPDLILADVKLAGTMDGIESVAAILKLLALPVIFVTAHTDPRTRARMEGLGPADILAKPVPDQLLLHAVAAALRD